VCKEAVANAPVTAVRLVHLHFSNRATAAHPLEVYESCNCAAVQGINSLGDRTQHSWGPVHLCRVSRSNINRDSPDCAYCAAAALRAARAWRRAAAKVPTMVPSGA
jgi:hypothetical protein